MLIYDCLLGTKIEKPIDLPITGFAFLNLRKSLYLTGGFNEEEQVYVKGVVEVYPEEGEAAEVGYR